MGSTEGGGAVLSVRHSSGGVRILSKGIVHGQSLGPLWNGQEEKAKSDEKDKVTLGGGSQVQLATHGILRGRLEDCGGDYWLYK